MTVSCLMNTAPLPEDVYTRFLHAVRRLKKRLGFYAQPLFAVGFFRHTGIGTAIMIDRQNSVNKVRRGCGTLIPEQGDGTSPDNMVLGCPLVVSERQIF